MNKSQKDYGNELFAYMNNQYPVFREIPQKTQKLKLQQDDGILFLTLLQYVLKKDHEQAEQDAKAGRAFDGGLFHYFLALRDLGVFLARNKNGSIVLMILDQDANGQSKLMPLRSVFESDEEYGSWIEPLKQNMAWLKECLREMVLIADMQ